jgi:lactose/L-arabinose transport system permease protein
MVPLALLWLLPLWLMFVFSTMPDNGIFSPGSTCCRRRVHEQRPGPPGRNGVPPHAAGRRWLWPGLHVLSVFLTSMAGWALVRYRFWGKGAVHAIILGHADAALLRGGDPQFILVARDLGMSNTWFALIVAAALQLLGVLFMRRPSP